MSEYCYPSEKSDDALLALGQTLRAAGYKFVTITPASHRRVIARRPASGCELRKIFGWNQTFDEAAISSQMLSLLRNAKALHEDGAQLRSLVRFSSLGEQLFVHSAFPTEARDSVFFGPDTYRFIRALGPAVQDLDRAAMTIADIGCGSGAGGLHIAAVLKTSRPTVLLSDINPVSLRYACVNARLNEIENVRTVHGDVCEKIGDADLIISNPPYLADSEGRLYRDGGGAFGLALSYRIIQESIGRLRPGGRLFLYTGTPIIAGRDLLLEFLQTYVDQVSLRYSYEEIDPDVFGEELESPPYDRVDRIALVGLTVKKERM